jgi:hypothetical protein
MNHDISQTDGRKPYEPPQLTTISLRPDEAVLSHCKTSTSGSFTLGSCHAFGLCKTQGS